MTPVGQYAANGIVAGGMIAAAPVALTLLTCGGNILKTVITGLMLKATTNGQWNTAFNVIITSPALWNITKYSCAVGSAISAISFIGFCFAEQRAPKWEEVKRT